MVHVLPHVVQVVVLPTRADALLRVGRALELGHCRPLLALAEEEGLELVHARVDEEERRVVVRHHRRRRPPRVRRLVREKVDEGGPHLGGGAEGAARRGERVGRGTDEAGGARGAVRTQPVDHLLELLSDAMLLEVGGHLGKEGCAGHRVDRLAGRRVRV